MHSPGLILGFHTCDHIDQMVQKHEAKKVPELKRNVVLAHSEINMEEVRKAILSWEGRMRACLAADGNRFVNALM